ncbi:MAG: PP2C family protein-serine/threonine phosphatase, partial [Ilumatobacter sp.]
VGHDVRAAIEMSQVRHVLASQLTSSGDPVAALARTDEYLCNRASNIMATALVAAFGRDGTVSLASAGHPPPVISSADGVTRLPNPGLGPPLGTGIGGFSARSEPMERGDVFVAYTDGVVETRDATVDAGITALRAHLSEAMNGGDAGPDAVVAMLQELVDTPWRIDDAAAVIVRAVE